MSHEKCNLQSCKNPYDWNCPESILRMIQYKKAFVAHMIEIQEDMIEAIATDDLAEMKRKLTEALEEQIDLLEEKIHCLEKAEAYFMGQCKCKEQSDCNKWRNRRRCHCW